MKRLLLPALLLGCTATPAATNDAATGDVPDALAAPDVPDVTVDAGPPRLAGRRCDAPAVWSQPLADYLAAGERVAAGRPFLRGVQDLAVFQRRLLVGYGDANINLGQRGGGSVAERRRDDANVRRWGRVHFAYKGVSSTSRTSHEAEGRSSEMLERRTALEFLSSLSRRGSRLIYSL